jgi:hypothetical protein
METFLAPVHAIVIINMGGSVEVAPYSSLNFATWRKPPAKLLSSADSLTLASLSRRVAFSLSSINISMVDIASNACFYPMFEQSHNEFSTLSTIRTRFSLFRTQSGALPVASRPNRRKNCSTLSGLSQSEFAVVLCRREKFHCAIFKDYFVLLVLLLDSPNEKIAKTEKTQ